MTSKTRFTDSPAEVAAPKGLETILGALAAAAVANLAAVLATGGYGFEVLGVSVRAHDLGRPLIIAVVLLMARCLAALRRVGFARAAKSIAPVGALVEAVSLAAFVYMAFGRGDSADGALAAKVGIVALLGFAAAWLSWGPGSPKAARVVVAVVSLSLVAALGDSILYPKSWSKTFGTAKAVSLSGGAVPADRYGLLSGSGSGVEWKKAALGKDWRDAAEVSSGGFFSAKVTVPADATLTFAAARGKGPVAEMATVTAVTGSSNVPLWAEKASALEDDRWHEVIAPAGLVGEAEIVFEVNGPEGASVLFANPRIDAPSQSRTNVIVMLVDALRADRLGLYGYARPTSREIDELASRGVVFDNCISQASWTLPSVATLFTSLFPSAHGVLKTTSGLSQSLETLAGKFGEAGYMTGAVQTNSLVVPDYGMAKGFAEFYTFGLLEKTMTSGELYYRAADVNGRALEWLHRHGANPFFLYLHYMDVHDPYEPPEEFRTFGETASDLYDGEISYFSSEFKSFFAALEKLGLLKNTIVVVTADHGEQFLEHGGTKHGMGLYSEEIHVPLVVWMPGESEGRRVAEVVRLIDLPVTLLDTAGAPKLEDASGESFSGALSGGAAKARDAFSELVTLYPPGQHFVSITRNRRRFIASNPEMGHRSVRLELYDLEKDPAEQKNLAAENLALVDGMLEEVRDYLKSQKNLNARLVPEAFRVGFDDKRREQLEAIGYLGPGEPGGKDER